MKPLLICFAIAFVLASCNNSGEPPTEKTESGLRYIIHHAKTPGRKVMMMATAKITVTEFRNDSVLPGRVPLYQMVLPPAPYMSDPVAEVMIRGEVGEGDSIVTITKNNKRGAFVIHKIYIPGEKGLNMDSLIQMDKNRDLEKLVASEIIPADKRINDYLHKNNITAEKAGDIYVQYLNKGESLKADSGKNAGIKYKISQLYTGKVINSNTDTSFHQPPVLDFQVGKGYMLKPVEHILNQLGKGGKANIYIPGVVAAGPKAADPSMDIAQDILFELEVVSVK